MYAVGTVWNVKAGKWVAIGCVSPCVIAEITMMGTDSALDGLYTYANLFVEARLGGERASQCFRNTHLMAMDKGWKNVLVDIINEDEGDTPFTFEEPKDGGTNTEEWEVTQAYYKLVEDERRKHAKLGALGGIARAFMHDAARLNMFVEGIVERGWGRLITWCSNSFGVNAYVAERRRALASGGRGRGRGRGRRGRGIVDEMEAVINDGQ